MTTLLPGERQWDFIDRYTDFSGLDADVVEGRRGGLLSGISTPSLYHTGPNFTILPNDNVIGSAYPCVKTRDVACQIHL